MWKPKYFHEMITNIVSITIDGSASQPWTGRPSRPLEPAIEQPVREQDQLEDDPR